MTTRAHQSRINTLAQQAVDVKQYFRSWTRDSALAQDTIQTLQHLSLLSPKPPDAIAVPTSTSIGLSTSLTVGSTAVLDMTAEHGRAYAAARGSTKRSTPSHTTSL